MTPFISKYRAAADTRAQSYLRRVPSFVWKRFEDGFELKMSFFAPPGHDRYAMTPSIVFFNGGMWALEYREEFVSWAAHLASRGIACLIPEYRNYARFDVAPDEIIHEGIEAWHWVHQNAAGLGIDPRRVTLAGADAGGLMALNAAMQPIVKKRRWWRWGSRDELPLTPACVAIFRGVVDTEAPEARMLRIAEQAPEPEKLNPCALLRKRLPPLFCAHGMLDPLLNFEIREWFCDEWRRLGNKAESVMLPQVDHTLTHFDMNPVAFEQILLEWELFMVQLGLWPEETVEERSLL